MTARFPTGDVRRLLLPITLLALGGLEAELLLLGHFESTAQRIPVVLLGLSLLTLGGFALSKRTAALRLFRLTMILNVAAGFTGLALHLKNNIEFELEMYPSMSGWTLFQEAMTGAVPTLAPGALIQIGLVGLAYAWRHPVLTPNELNDFEETGETT